MKALGLDGHLRWQTGHFPVIQNRQKNWHTLTHDVLSHLCVLYCLSLFFSPLSSLIDKYPLHNCYNAASLGPKEQGQDDNDNVDNDNEEDDEDDGNDSNAGSSVDSQASNEEGAEMVSCNDIPHNEDDKKDDNIEEGEEGDD